ncbi:hypothetical protein VTK26DRAFT_8240 [Humicola hyalothermophila]
MRIGAPCSTASAEQAASPRSRRSTAAKSATAARPTSAEAATRDRTGAGCRRPGSRPEAAAEAWPMRWRPRCRSGRRKLVAAMMRKTTTIGDLALGRVNSTMCRLTGIWTWIAWEIHRVMALVRSGLWCDDGRHFRVAHAAQNGRGGEMGT